jgi:hypothetical protein
LIPALIPEIFVTKKTGSRFQGAAEA